MTSARYSALAKSVGPSERSACKANASCLVYSKIPQLAIGAIIRSVSAQTSASTLPGEKPARPRSKFDVKLHC